MKEKSTTDVMDMWSERKTAKDIRDREKRKSQKMSKTTAKTRELSKRPCKVKKNSKNPKKIGHSFFAKPLKKNLRKGKKENKWREKANDVHSDNTSVSASVLSSHDLLSSRLATSVFSDAISSLAASQPAA